MAIAYVRLSGRQLFVDWRGGLYGCATNRNLFDDLFELTGVEVAAGISNSESVHPPRWTGALEKTLAAVYEEDGERPWVWSDAVERYSFDLGELAYPHSVLVMWDFNQMGKLRTELEARLAIPRGLSDHEAMGVIYRRHVRLRARLQRRLEETWVSVSRGGERVIGVHVRATRENARARGEIRLWKYFAIVDGCLEAEDSVVFLATDNEAVQQRFEKRYGKRVRLKPKWFDRPGQPLHLGNPRCPEPLENVVNALLELLVLSRCQTLVHPSASSFSVVARLVGGLPSERVRELHYRRPLVERVYRRLSVQLSRWRA